MLDHAEGAVELIQVDLSITVRAGAVSRFRELCRRLTDAAEGNEGVLLYVVGETGNQSFKIVEAYENAAVLERQVKIFGLKFANEFAAYVESLEVTVVGSPGPNFVKAMASVSPKQFRVFSTYTRHRGPNSMQCN